MLFWVECSLGYFICFGTSKILDSQLLECNFLPYNISGLQNTEVETRMRERTGGKRHKKVTKNDDVKRKLCVEMPGTPGLNALEFI